MEEIWKPVVGYEDKLEVSNLGRVRGVTSTFSSTNQNGAVFSVTRQGRIRKLHVRENGYVSLRVPDKDRRMKCLYVHRLVAEAFLPNPHGLPCVNHKDENPSNNHVDNLEWCTYQYNTNYGTRTKRFIESNHKPVGKYDLSGNLLATYPSAEAAAVEAGVRKQQIRGVCQGRKGFLTAGGYIWRYIDKQSYPPEEANNINPNYQTI